MAIEVDTKKMKTQMFHYHLKSAIFVRGFWSQFDAWSGTHFFGPYFLCDVWSVKAAVVGVIIWEILDLIYSISRYFIVTRWAKKIDHIFDPRGVSWGDIALGFIAIGIWILRH